MTTQPAELTRLSERWNRFRTGRNAALASDHGWLTLSSFQWLPTTPSALAGIPGRWSADGARATLTAGTEDSLTLVDGDTLVSGTITATLADEESIRWVRSGSVVVELGMRADRYMIRTRDSASPTFVNFSGVPVFDYNPNLVFTATFERYEQPRTSVVATANPEVPGLTVLVGDVVFDLDGTTYRLAAQEAALDSLIVTFYDETNNDTSSHWRKLELTKPRPDGTVVVDFNRAINYPSAFTDYGTCPSPVAGNTINAPIEAGEKDPRK